MSNFRSRLFTEYNELQQRISKLKEFILGDTYDSLLEVDRSDLKEQLHHMENYYQVLSRRVSRQCNNA